MRTKKYILEAMRHVARDDREAVRVCNFIKRRGVETPTSTTGSGIALSDDRPEDVVPETPPLCVELDPDQWDYRRLALIYINEEDAVFHLPRNAASLFGGVKTAGCERPIWCVKHTSEAMSEIWTGIEYLRSSHNAYKVMAKKFPYPTHAFTDIKSVDEKIAALDTMIELEYETAIFMNRVIDELSNGELNVILPIMRSSIRDEATLLRSLEFVANTLECHFGEIQSECEEKSRRNLFHQIVLADFAPKENFIHIHRILAFTNAITNEIGNASN